MAAPEESIVTDPGYGEEVSVWIAASARTIRTDAGAVGDSILGANYVRVLDSEGREIAYWTCDEWAEQPVEVLGAILGAMAGCGELEVPMMPSAAPELPEH